MINSLITQFDQTLSNTNYENINSSRGIIWESMEYKEQSESIVYQGVLFELTLDSQNINEQHYLLYPDKLVKYGPTLKFIQINQFQLKVIKQLQIPNIHENLHGFKLQKGLQSLKLYNQSQDIVESWLQQLKRFCINVKFIKKHKLTNKIQNLDYPKSIYYSCYKLESGKNFTVRMIDKSILNTEDKQKFNTEIKILRQLKHKMVYQLKELFEDEMNYYLIFENFFFQDMQSNLATYANLEESQKSYLMYKLILVVDYYNRRGIIHRNINPKTIVQRSQNNIYDICIIHFQNGFLLNEQHSFECNVGFHPPEYFITNHSYEKWDIFQLGIIFYYLCYKRFPFNSKNSNDLMDENKNCQINFPQVFNISNAGIDLLKQMLKRNPKERISIQQAQRHYWFLNMRSRETSSCKFIKPYSMSTINEKSEKCEFSVSRANLNYEPLLEEEMDQFSVFKQLKQLNSLKFIQAPSSKLLQIKKNQNQNGDVHKEPDFPDL